MYHVYYTYLKAIVRLPYPRIGDSLSQETFLAPPQVYVYIHYFILYTCINIHVYTYTHIYI